MGKWGGEGGEQREVCSGPAPLKQSYFMYQDRDRGCPIVRIKDSAVSEVFGQDYNSLRIDMVESPSPSSIEGALMSWDSKER